MSVAFSNYKVTILNILCHTEFQSVTSLKTCLHYIHHSIVGSLNATIDAIHVLVCILIGASDPDSV